MSQDNNNKLQNRVRIGGVDYYFSVDFEPVDGSTKPISSGAVSDLQQQLALFLGRGLGIVGTVDRHEKSDNGQYILTNDYNLVLAEAVRVALDTAYDIINKIAKRVYNTEKYIHDNLNEDFTVGKSSY